MQPKGHRGKTHAGECIARANHFCFSNNILYLLKYQISPSNMKKNIWVIE
jgi:hypothetical protein